MAIIYPKATAELARIFKLAEADVAAKATPPVDKAAAQAAAEMFESSTQSIREALLGCALARLMDQTIDIRLAYMNHGANAFNGRTLDEKVINPFLKDKEIPSSKGPYLASFRRSVKFDTQTAKGMRDQKGFAAMLLYLGHLEAAKTPADIEPLIRHLLWRFVMLRDQSKITLSRINRLSLGQLHQMIVVMLGTKSGGRFPVLLSSAMFKTLKHCFNLPWEIKQQGINSADAAAKSGGDIDVMDEKTGQFVFSVEITERPIGRDRVVSTFSSKISPHSIEDYLFFYSTSLPDDAALTVAKQYFAQGHDISFLKVDEWLKNCLGVVGPKGRTMFTNEFVNLLDHQDTPSVMKVLWNDLIKNLGGPAASAAEKPPQ